MLEFEKVFSRGRIGIVVISEMISEIAFVIE
jgi:hypothetical protein